MQDAGGKLRAEELYAIPHNPNGHNPQGLIVADVNGDAQKDVLLTDNFQRKLLLLYHQTPGEIAPDIVVTSPNGNENLVPGTTKQITWTASASVKRVRIDYSLDGINFLPIVAAAPNTGSVAWIVPDRGSSRAIIRIFDETGRAWDTNDEFFSIQSCRATLTAIRRIFEPTNGGFGVAILAIGPNCRWQAMADVEWVKFTMIREGNGNASVAFDVGGGFGFGPRTAVVAIGDAKLNIVRAGNFTSVSAAKYQSPVSPESIVAGFGKNLATGIARASVSPLPTSLLGTTVKVKDSYGTERLAPLFFVSPTQINYQVPPGTSIGSATVTVTSGNGDISIDPLFVQRVAYGVFSMDASGSGPAAAYAVRVKGGQQTTFPTANYDQTQKKWVNLPIDLSKPGEDIFLVLYATGLRLRNTAIPTRVIFGNLSVDAEYAGPQGQLVGLDQINVRLPKSLIGAGELSLIFFVDNTYANNVTVSFQ